jgi:hypothetical protein
MQPLIRDGKKSKKIGQKKAEHLAINFVEHLLIVNSRLHDI